MAHVTQSTWLATSAKNQDLNRNQVVWIDEHVLSWWAKFCHRVALLWRKVVRVRNIKMNIFSGLFFFFQFSLKNVMFLLLTGFWNFDTALSFRARSATVTSPPAIWGSEQKKSPLELSQHGHQHKRSIFEDGFHDRLYSLTIFSCFLASILTPYVSIKKSQGFLVYATFSSLSDSQNEGPSVAVLVDRSSVTSAYLTGLVGYLQRFRSWSASSGRPSVSHFVAASFGQTGWTNDLLSLIFGTCTIILLMFKRFLRFSCSSCKSFNSFAFCSRNEEGEFVDSRVSVAVIFPAKRCHVLGVLELKMVESTCANCVKNSAKSAELHDQLYISKWQAILDVCLRFPCPWGSLSSVETEVLWNVYALIPQETKTV